MLIPLESVLAGERTHRLPRVTPRITIPRITRSRVSKKGRFSRTPLGPALPNLELTRPAPPVQLGGLSEEIYEFAGRGTSRGWIFFRRKYVSTRPGPEGWARVRAGEGAGQAYLSFAIDWRLTSSDAKRGPARDGGGDEYGQRGAFGAVRAVPGAPREGHRQRDEDGAKTAESGEKSPALP